ncbi:MAG: hypothetical protein HQ574_08970 [Chloroflexi bacterium]|nr:hypothetical protein [Chloroflexota bacterium]
MSKKSKRWVVLGLFITLFISGCKCNNAAVAVFEVIADSPTGGELVTSLTPLFEWHGSDTCDPDRYHLYIKEDKPYGGDVAYADVPYTGVPYTLSGDSLLPGRSYYWQGRAENDYESSEDPGAHGQHSEPAYFFTGPVCSGETLIAPDLVTPYQYGGNTDTDNWITHNGQQEFKWTYTGGCLPVSYDYQFATDAGFTDIVLSGITTEPYVQHIYENFPNCSTLFWRVAANDGTTVGPWSAARNFHWVTDDTCWQTHYLSDDFAWLNVRLYEDLCPQTGFLANITQSLDPGCMIEGMIIVGDGTHNHYLRDFDVDLGSGPCPSTGLDHKTAGSQATFGVLTPGTYCVSITRDQTVNDSNTPKTLMEGIWTSPRTNKILAQQTIELGPGTSDNLMHFVWDPIERNFLTYPFNENKNCRIAPYTGCPIADIAMVGDFLPIFARYTNSDWKLSEMNGTPCYIFLPSADMDARLAELGGGFMTADLPIFPMPPDCPPPAPEPRPGHTPTCSDYSTRTACNAHIADGCTWSGSTASCVGP